MVLVLFSSCKPEPVPTEPFNLVNVMVDGVSGKFNYTEVGFNPLITIDFSTPLDTSVVNDNIRLFGNSGSVELDISFEDSNRRMIVRPGERLEYLSRYSLRIMPSLSSHQQVTLDNEYLVSLFTKIDSTPKYPVIADDELLTKVQEYTFRYFWDYGHPVSGMARERLGSGETVTTGGTGFGMMAVLVGIERGFVTRSQGVQRISTIVDFLANKAERFHGAWSHWLNGTTGKAMPFSTYDDGGDLVETSFLAAGLITVREYLDPGIQDEQLLMNNIDALLEGIEWDWFTKGGEDVLYWHWSPNYEWKMNMPIRGYNEALIVYVLAASSSDHPIDASVYHNGWAGNGSIINGNEYYGIKLPLGYDYGGPLFFAHYSFLGLDPSMLNDTYANYWEQNSNHTLINRAYCIDNPRNYYGYGEECWGLTASDGNAGYSAHSPTNDRGVITPTAALSSFPYTPEESMEVLKFLYYTLGDRMWGPYGFYDAMNLSEGWVANSYLAIDQGPIVVMIENYRSRLCWDLFMSNENVQSGLSKLGFSY